MGPSMPVSIDDILSALRTFDGTYPREMVAAALQRREEITPRLIAILEEIIADPEGFLEAEDRFDHIYALMLLGHFRAVQAHAAIVQIFSLKPKQVADLFADHVAEALPVVLLRTCGGDLRHIRIMALDRSLDTYCRLAAVQAMVYAVAAGIAHREEVLTFIAGLFAGAPQEPDSAFFSFAAVSLLNLYPEEHMALIEKAFEDEIIDPAIVELEDFEETLALGQAHAQVRLRQELDRYDLADLHARMSGWACFDNNQEWAAAEGPQDLFDSGLFGSPQPNPAGKKDGPPRKRRPKRTKLLKRKSRP